MKKSLLLVLLPCLLTTGCFSSSINEDKMKEVVNEVEAKVSAGDFTNVHINDKIQHKYDYKEGEFYRYSDFALLLIVPITELVCTWTQDGKYYHYEKYSANEKKNKDEEITKEQFDLYMAEHKKSVQYQLENPVKASKKLLGTYKYEETDYTKYKSIKDTSYKYNSFEKEYTQKGTGVYDVTLYEDGVEKTVEKEDKYTIVYKNGMPVKMTTKNDGDQTWKFSYGKAEFKNPKENND